MEHNIAVTFNGDLLEIENDNVDWFAFGCAAGMMAADEESGEYRHNLCEFAKGIKAALDYQARKTRMNG